MILIATLVVVAVGLVPLPWGAILIAGGLLAELGETLFWVWLSKRRRSAVGPQTLVGMTLEVVQACHPVGQVRAGGEIWRARCDDGAEVGEVVRVRTVRGLELIVERAPPASPPSPR